MKKSLWLISFSAFLLLATSASAQKLSKKEKKQQVENLSYAYGAMISKGILRMNLAKDEKNPDKFVEGIKKGIEGDSATFAKAQEILQARMQGGVASTTPEEGGEIAYNIGISAIGGLAVEVEIPASDFDFKVFKSTFIAAEAGEPLKYKDPEMDSILKAYFNPLNDKYQKAVESKKMAAAAFAIKAGKDFLEANGKKENIVTLASGLQYEILKEGKGPKPTLTDKVVTHYHGTLTNGDVFDSSVDRGAPATFGVNQVIKGWQEGIPLMSLGAKYKFYIPQDLAYGLQAPSPKIPGGSALIFEVELLEINPGAKETNVAAAGAATNGVAAGVAFLKENATKEGVVTLPSGLQYQVLVQGTGPKPTITDKVKTHYHGTLIDGTIFDSSVDRGTPATFGVNQVIKGWQEGIPLMAEGSKYRLFIPQELAYGMRATGKIPAGSALIFDVELIKVNP
jgi:FKBP-type peptidyl-prolyl cis-trans isomerase